MRNSRNLVEHFEEEGLRIVVCRPQIESIGRHRKQQEQRKTHTQLSPQYQDTDFPNLSGHDGGKKCVDALDTSTSPSTYAGIARTASQQTYGTSSEHPNPLNGKKQLKPRRGGKGMKSS